MASQNVGCETDPTIYGNAIQMQFRGLENERKTPINAAKKPLHSLFKCNRIATALGYRHEDAFSVSDFASTVRE
jgi:hypothetical protein